MPSFNTSIRRRWHHVYRAPATACRLLSWGKPPVFLRYSPSFIILGRQNSGQILQSCHYVSLSSPKLSNFRQECTTSAVPPSLQEASSALSHSSLLYSLFSPMGRSAASGLPCAGGLPPQRPPDTSLRQPCGAVAVGRPSEPKCNACAVARQNPQRRAGKGHIRAWLCPAAATKRVATNPLTTVLGYCQRQKDIQEGSRGTPA